MLLRNIKFLQQNSGFIFRNKFQLCHKILGNTLMSSQTNFDKHDSIAMASATAEERTKYMSFYSEIVDYLVNERFPKDAYFFRDKYRKMFEYNIEKGWELRGIMVVSAYKTLADEKDITEANLKLASILGLCIELLHTALIITDDLCDGSEFRRNLPCWYKYDGQGTDVINHAFLINYAIYFVLEKYFSNNRFYPSIMEVLNNTAARVALGQSLEKFGIKNGKPQLDLYTFERFQTIARHKAGYCVYYPPVLLASYLADKYNKALHDYLKRVINQFGVLLQAKNDIIDLGDSVLYGKKNSDVAAGVCTWPVVTALQRATPAQRKIIEDNYGTPGLKAEMAMKALYEELEIVKLYYEYEKLSVDKTHEIIRELPNEKERNVLYNLWNM